GVDLDVTVGSLVLAPDDGVVVHAGQVVDRGVVSVQHGDHRSTFEPVTPLVSAGQVVARGQPLASVEGGHSPGALHWGVRSGAKSYDNPLRMLVVRVVLKPWEG
ncbi:MAG: M23 family metallopeptidase, partial [Actinomyces sp.]|nr:M23 family metallopeptidase [Actinomyces sp.]